MTSHVYVSPSHTVRVYPPTSASPYWRITYLDHLGVRKHARGGRTPKSAMQRAAELERLYFASSQASGARTFSDLIYDYVDPGRPKFLNGKRRRYDSNQSWSSGYAALLDSRLQRVHHKAGHVKLSRLTRRHMDELINEANTVGQARALQSTLRAIVNFGVEQGYLRPEQRHIVEVVIHRPRPSLTRHPNLDLEEGESVELVSPNEIPTNLGVHRLSVAAVGYQHWEGMVNVLGYAGLRIHECLALTADDVEQRTDEGGVKYLVLKVERQVIEPRGGGLLITKTKNRKRRKVVLAPSTPNGFPLADWVWQRAREAKQEQKAGKNEPALLFPSPRQGGYWRIRNLRRSAFVPAALEAGWDFQESAVTATVIVGGKRVTRRTRARVWRHTLHSLRHRFATTAHDDWGWNENELCSAGGWASEAFVMARYYGRTDEVLATASRKQSRATEGVIRKRAEPGSTEGTSLLPSHADGDRTEAGA